MKRPTTPLARLRAYIAEQKRRAAHKARLEGWGENRAMDGAGGRR